jgi:hypothetical protein
MRTEQETRQLKEELEKLTGFIGEHGSPEQVASKDFQVACNTCDALAWVLGEIQTDHFKSDAHLNLEVLKNTATYIETTTGEKLANHE